jgi:MSHA biogenesis protein MshO
MGKAVLRDRPAATTIRGTATTAPCATLAAHAGFTLVELVVVIAVVGILAGMVAVFIRTPIEGYLAASRRAEMVDIADTALLRIARDVRAALPNSLRVRNTGGVYYLEFLPVQDGGMYRSAQDATAGCIPPDGTTARCDILDFASGSDAGFDVLGPAVSAIAGQFMVVYNLGLDAATDAWQGGNRRVVTSSGSVSTLNFAATGTPLPLESPTGRFFLAGAPVSYVCDPSAHTIRRYWGYSPGAAQPTSFAGGGSALLATRVKACSFSYDAGASQRLGQLTLWIQLENTAGDNAESVSLYREVAVNNEA